MNNISMKSGSFLIVLSFLTLQIAGQKKTIGLDDIRTLQPSYGVDIVSTPDGEYYTTIGKNQQTIEKYSYATGKLVATLLDLTTLKDHNIKTIQGYEVNSTESRILIYTNKKSIYRRSFTADYYLYDMAKREIKPLSEGGAQQAASFSPNGDMAAYVKGNDIHLVKIRFGTESAITTDGQTGKIINGIPDWNYEEEMEFNKAYEWSPDSREIAYIKFDELQVGTYSMPVYKASNPTVDSCKTYPGEMSVKYPKSGTANSKVSVHVFNIKNRTTKKMDTGKDEDIYIPRIVWSYNFGELGIFRLNRLQNQLDILLANSASTVSHVMLTDRNEKYIDTDVLDNFAFMPDSSGIIYMSEDDGFSHLYRYAMSGKLLNQVTKGNWDVTRLLGYKAVTKMVY